MQNANSLKFRDGEFHRHERVVEGVDLPWGIWRDIYPEQFTLPPDPPGWSEAIQLCDHSQTSAEQGIRTLRRRPIQSE